MSSPFMPKTKLRQMGELDETVRRRLRDWLEASRKAVTQETMSAALGKKQSYAQRYLDGEIRRVDLQTLQIWARCFGKTLNELLNVESDPNENLVLEKWRMLTPRQQDGLMAILDGLTQGIVRPQDR
jgi:transcriptional regulator with XRE-family HTH domain